ncbi:type II toxin-antitoxin system VapC family toxin, partial [Candidatus Collierbacteria bacterium]|nr:type II toxin-antitoxin system VapC family toxin [Candidatus Collierbacteria bacterium]
MEGYLADANILLRYLVGDVKDQFEFAKKKFELAQSGKIVISIPLLILVEINFILRKFYEQPKDKVIKIILR